MAKYLIALLCLTLGHQIARAQVYAPCDRYATAETRWLYGSLQRLIGAGIIFGHHDDLAYGVGWRGDANRSDIKSVTGSYPALYGWDLSGLEHDKLTDINGIPFKQQRRYVEEIYARGGINTFCWHLPNPVNGKSAWDTTLNTVQQIIPGGAFHQAYVDWLDKVAKYLETLKGDEGEPIPILFRPFHELTGNWFWWCQNKCSREDFITLWRFTVDYLRKDKKLHNLLIVYSVADINSEAEFMDRYPGDAYVDVVGFDSYCRNEKTFAAAFEKRVAITQSVALAHHKVGAVAETGYNLVPDATWWTKVVLPIVSKYGLSYLMVWRNAGMEQYFAPYPGQASAEDFKLFFKNEQTMFQNRITGLWVYGKYVLQK
jgi:mannan endo-1,4-beta-mannosidase